MNQEIEWGGRGSWFVNMKDDYSQIKIVYEISVKRRVENEN